MNNLSIRLATAVTAHGLLTDERNRLDETLSREAWNIHHSDMESSRRAARNRYEATLSRRVIIAQAIEDLEN